MGLLLAGGIAQAATSSSVSAPTITEYPASFTTSTTATFRFSGPSGAKFSCSLDDAPFAKCTSPITYRNLSEGGHTFNVKATVVKADSSSTMYGWTIDSVAPPAPSFTQKPDNPTYNATNFFAWTDAEPDVTYQCSQENGPWAGCTSPLTWVIETGNYGLHQFAVRAVDAAGNSSIPTTYTFKYEKKLPDSGVPFTITGQVDPLAIGIWQPIRLTITNPNSVPIFVSALNVAISTDSTPSGCSSLENIELEQSDVSTDKLLKVLPNEPLTLPAQNISAPRMRLINLPTVNQDVCKNKRFDLTLSGTATN